MAAVRYVFRATCRVPIAPPKAKPGEPPVLVDVYAGPACTWEEADCEFQEWLPFLPIPGMRLQLSPHAPFMTVREVKWSCHAPGLVCCYMDEVADPRELPWSTDLRPDGWTIAT